MRFGWLLILVFSLSSWSIDYFNPGRYQAPVLDAKDAYKSGRIQFAGVLKDQKVRLPGLNASERTWVKDERIKVRLMNEWAAYDPTPLPIDQAITIERYATRYNKSMLTLIRTHGIP